MLSAFVERWGPSGYVPFPTDVFLEDRTGQGPFSTEILALKGALPVFQSRVEVANLALRSALVGVMGSPPELGGSITSYGIVFRVEVTVWATLVTTTDPLGLALVVLREQRGVKPAGSRSDSSRPVRRARATSMAITPAEELRALTGLAPGMLADLFGISRTTFYKWIEGSTPRDERFRHLVDVLAHVKDARQRLPASIEFTSWLRTPISPGAKSPLAYLRDERFTVFRGLVLRATSGPTGFASPVASAIPERSISRTDRAIARDRISPPPRLEEDED